MEVQNNSALSNPSIYSTHAPSSSSWSQISLALQGGQRAEHPLTHSLHGLTAMPSGIGVREIEEGGAPSVRTTARRRHTDFPSRSFPFPPPLSVTRPKKMWAAAPVHLDRRAWAAADLAGEEEERNGIRSLREKMPLFRSFVRPLLEFPFCGRRGRGRLRAAAAEGASPLPLPQIQCRHRVVSPSS